MNKGEKCWLISVLYIFNLAGINPDMEQLHLISNSNVLSSIVDKLQSMFEEKFFNEIANSSKLIIYNHVKEEFWEEKYIHEVKYYKYRSATTKFRISAHTFPFESGRWDKTPREKRMCPLCFSNDIDDEKHYIFHCTNPKLVEIRKTFTPEIYAKFTPYPDVNSIIDILHIILRGSYYVNYNRIGKFLSLVLEKTQDLLMEVEKDKGSASRN